MALTQVAPGMMSSTAQYYNFKNRIINGAFNVSQYNGTSTQTVNNTQAYPVDRWLQEENSGTLTCGQNTANAPVSQGFSYCYGVTVTSASSSTSNQTADFRQFIEQNNTLDFAWGTANAKAVTVSFWAYSSLTGTYCCSLRNYNASRSYVQQYTISSANTWQYVTLTFPGDTAGSLGSGNGAGLGLYFDLGSGSNFQTTPGSWVSGNYRSTSSQVNFVNTASATWYVTGVQLEVGSTATAFDYRDYGRELQMCQRYFNKSFAQATAPANYTNSQKTTWLFTAPGASGTYGSSWVFPVNMRASPTITLYNPQASGTAGYWHGYTSSSESDYAFGVLYVTDTRWSPWLSGSTTLVFAYGEFTASAEL